jgi:TonB-linked SusC/RagA family outer membrane protein
MLNGDQYIRLILDEKFNRNPIGLSSIPTEYLNDPNYPLYYNYNKNTDWVKAVTQNGFTHDVNFSVAGGGDKARYRASLGYYDQLGTTIGTNLSRLTTRLNLDYNISDKLKLSTDFSYTNSDKDQNYFDDDWGSRNRQVRSMAYRKAPHMSIYEYDEEGNLTGNYFSPLQSQQGTGLNYLNPVAMANDGIFNDRKDRILTNFLLKYQILRGLDYYANVAFDITNNHNSKLFPQSATGVQIGNSQLNKVQSKEDIQNIIQTFNKLIYKPDLGEKHDWMLLGMFSTYDKYATQFKTVSAGMPSYILSDPSNIGIENGAGSYRARVRTLSYLINTNYVYNDRYIVGGGIRIDGDSRFGPNNRYGYFPSMSVAWRMSSEEFMSSFNKLSDLKFRLSYGVNGYSTGSSYQYLSKYTSTSGYLGNNGINLANIELNNLRWETTTQFNYGLDASFFKYRLNITFDYYDKYTNDMIFNNLAIPSTTGFTSVTSNFGSLSNKGWELNINAKIIEMSKFKVGLDFNFARNVNIIESLPENYSNERFSVSNGSYAKRIIVGDPMGAFYGFRYLGVFSNSKDAVAFDENGSVILDPVTGKPLPYLINGQSVKAGDAHYEDINFDGNINELDIVYLGNANPDFFGGFGVNVQYKNLSLNAFFNYKIGQDVINETRMYNENMYTMDNQSTAVLRRWRSEGDVTDIPRALYGQGLNWLGSDRFVEQASFVKMKSLTANYIIDNDWIKGLGIKNLKAFVTAYNIFTMTNYTGQDPDVGYNVSNDLFQLGKDISMTPLPISLTMGINMTF